MEFNTRTEQLAFAVGFAKRAKPKQIDEALSVFFSRAGFELTTADVFQCAPFNHSLEHIVRGMRIYEKAKTDQSIVHLQDMLAEFFQLVSDFEPPCAYDGRAFYVVTAEGNIAMQCDRTMRLYSLDGSSTDEKFKRFALRRDFVEHYGDKSAEKWPYHQSLLVIPPFLEGRVSRI